MVLVDTNGKITKAWSEYFFDCENVQIVNDSIFKIECDAIISPANSFGYMNGGLDFTISKNMGWHLEKKLQSKIRNEYFGELLIGQSIIIETGNQEVPFLISAPTMRTPMTITKSPNVYLAMKAILTLVLFGEFSDGSRIRDKVKTIAIPGLGCGVGNVSPKHCARQMRLAYDDILNAKYKTIQGWENMCSNYAYFYTEDEQDIKTW